MISLNSTDMLCNRLSIILKEKGLKQEDLARNLHASPSNVSRWCTNTSQPDREIFYRAALYLDIPEQNLYYGTPKIISVPLASPAMEVSLSQLHVPDALLFRVIGKTDLAGIQNVLIQRRIDFGPGEFKVEAIHLTPSLYQNPKIPIIEVRTIIEDCDKTKLIVHNAKEDISIFFLCPNLH